MTTTTFLQVPVIALIARSGKPSRSREVLLRTEFKTPGMVVLNLRGHHTNRWPIDRVRLVCALRGYPTEPNPNVDHDVRVALDMGRVVVQRTTSTSVTTVKLPWAQVLFFLDLLQQRTGSPR